MQLGLTDCSEGNMKISGLQKLTLLDYPGIVACTVFTYGCNMRCPFCHNASLVTEAAPSEISSDEFFAFLSKRKGVLDGVCVTGGEPLLQDGIEEFCEKIKSLGYKVKLDTNGTFPDKLERIVKSGAVDYVAMDIKNSLRKYSLTVGKDVDTNVIKRSVDFLKRDSVDYEFRTTLVNGLHDEDSIRGIGELIKGAKRYFLQNFVDSGDLIGKASGLDRETTLKLLGVAKEYVPETELRGLD